MIKFSIIIPVYNVEHYLRECVDSVLRQNYQNLEIILVDDGSNDASGAICDEYAKSSDKIKVIHKENGGLSSARNAGIDTATGDYLLFLDSDDFYSEKNCLNQFAKVLEEEQPDFLMFKLGKYYEDEETIDFYGDYQIQDIQDDKAAILEYMVREHKQLACACNKVVSRSLFQDDHLRFELGTIGEDIQWTIQLFEASKKIRAINIMPYMYRQSRDGSITSNVTKKKLNDLYSIIYRLTAKYQQDDSLFGRAVWAFLAFEYAILLLNISRCQDDIEINDYRPCAWVLKYAQDRNSKLVSVVVRISGIKNAVKLLKLRKG